MQQKFINFLRALVNELALANQPPSEYYYNSYQYYFYDIRLCYFHLIAQLGYDRRGRGGVICISQGGLHSTVPAEKQGHCKICRKNTRRICSTCHVPVHDDCMRQLHQV